MPATLDDGSCRGCHRRYAAQAGRALCPYSRRLRTIHYKHHISMNYKWTYDELTPEESARAALLAKEVAIHPALGSLLVRRGITTPAEARRFFRPQLSELHDPFLMNDMQAAVDRLNDALGRKERILVYGDYDVDGCTAVALVYKFLAQFYSNIDFYIPDRYDEGYGISRKGVDFAAETGVRLIIVLDCGI